MKRLKNVLYDILRVVLDVVITIALMFVLVALIVSIKELYFTARAAEVEEPKEVSMLVIPARLNERERQMWDYICRKDNERLLTERFGRPADPESELEEPEPESIYTEEDLELLAIVIYSEAGSDSISNDTRRMVGEVVLNRVADDRYPNTIREVLEQKGQYGRFYWTGVVWPSRASRSVEAHAVERAYECAKLVFTEERLLPTDVVYQAAHIQGEIVAHAPGFYFCR